MAASWLYIGFGTGKSWKYEEGPFTPLHKPISQMRLGLIASSGHYVHGDDPQPFGIKDMTQEEAAARIEEFFITEPTLSSIPMNTPRENLRVRHGGYDIRGVQADFNVALPLDRLQELQEEGFIGELTPNAYSFVGACSQLRLLNHTGSQWVTKFHQEQVEAVVLVPV